MRKYLTVVLVFLFTTFTASAQITDEIEVELNQQKVLQQKLDVSEWFQDQGYLRSNLMYAVVVLSRLKRPPVDKVMEILNASINFGQLQKSDWYLLARFCQKAPLTKGLVKAENSRTENANLLVSWCEENNILKQFIQHDAGNAYAYLFQMDFSADDPYNRQNQHLLEKAAGAEYASDYYGFGLDTYTTHLREYFSLQREGPFIPPAVFALADYPEDAISIYYSYAVVTIKEAYSIRVLMYCDSSHRKLQPGYDEKTVLACLRLMDLYRSDNNKLSDYDLANEVIASLNPPGSDEQLEANRQKITSWLVLQCLSTWGDSVGIDPYDMVENAIFLRTIPLLESMSELQALALASDQYFADIQNIDEPKPSSCLLLKDLSLEDAEKLWAKKK